MTQCTEVMSCTCVRQGYMEPVVSKENTISTGPPGGGGGAAAAATEAPPFTPGLAVRILYNYIIMYVYVLTMIHVYTCMYVSSLCIIIAVT